MDGEFIFHIPSSLDDLTAPPPEDFEEAAAYDKLYHVEKVYSANQLESLLIQAEGDFRRDTYKFILNHFDVFFSVIKHFPALSNQVRDKAWLLLLKGLNKFHPELVTFFEHFNFAQRREYQNMLLMLMYPFLTMSNFYEEDDIQGSLGDFDNYGGGRGKKKKVVGGNKGKEYQNSKSQAAKTISRIFALNLERLFESPTQLTHLVNIVTKNAYKMLENGSMLRGSTQSPIFTDICFIIGTALDKYEHGTTYCMRLIELLQGKESMIPIVSALVSNHIRGNHNIYIIDILLQIKALDLNSLSKDNSASKAVGTFLVEVCKSCPEKMYQNLSTLVEFLEQDPYTLRNAVLEVICHIIMTMFSLPTKNRDIEIKRKLMDFLYEHIHDTNSYTRSKVLQLWSRLAEAGVIPMAKLNYITRRIVGRLEDKSCFVRKNAVHFLTQSIKDNPFTILRNKELDKFKSIYQKQYEKHKDQLEVIKDRQFQRLEEFMKLSGSDATEDDRSNLSTDSNKENDEEFVADPSTGVRTQDSSKRTSGEPLVGGFATKRQKLMEDIQAIAMQWLALEDDFEKFWERTGKGLNLSEFIPEDIPQEGLQEAFTFFRNLVRQREFEKALRVLIALKTMYPAETIFQYRQRRAPSGENNLDDDDDDNGSQPMDALFNTDDHLFLSAVTNFSTDFSNKLPYELDLARLVFLAPLIDFGNAAIESGEQGGNNQKDDCLKNFFEQHGGEMESNQSSIERLESFLSSVSQILFRIGEAQVFLDMLSESVPKICQLLQSKNVADVQEAITFFKFAFKLKLANAIIGVQRMLKLIFTKEKTIKDKLMETFTEIYLNESISVRDEEQQEPLNDEEDEEPMPNMKHIALMEVRNLSHMVLQLNQGELVCAEALIQEIYRNNKFTQMHLQVLWERYAMKLSRTNEEEARAALIIIGMLASAQPNLVHHENNLATLIKVSLEDRCSDYRLVADTCDVFIRAFKLPSTDSCDQFIKMEKEHQLFVRLRAIMIESFTNTENKYWNRMASSIIKVIYFYADNPDYLISSIVEDTYKKLASMAKDGDLTNWSALSSQKTTSERDPFSQLSAASEAPSQSSKASGSMVDDILVARFLLILGDVAMNLLIHLDLHLMREIKIRQYMEDKESEKKKDNLLKKKKKTDKRKTGNKSLMSNTINSISVDGMEDEMDEMIGPSSNEDPFQERVTKICNEAILYGPGMLAKFKELIEEIASDYAGVKYSLIVRVAASLALAKFMVLSLKFTREKREVLAGLLDRSKDWEIRSNAIISFGDLLVRFPNEFEHFTGKIFSCLNDDSFTVRSNALKVLTRLILADMIKPKGHISKIARLVTDSDDSIRGTAQLFFIELGKKNNVYIYNFLPDIISNLSGRDGMAEDKFQEMIRFLFELLEKTRSTESLVTKLCARFPESTIERNLRDLSFCLSQLQFNDRAMINLNNNLEHFIQSLSYDAIFDHFNTIFSNARKTGTLKPETKLIIDEMETKIKEVRSKGIEQQNQQGGDGQEEEDTGDGAGDIVVQQPDSNAVTEVVDAGSTYTRSRRGRKKPASNTKKSA